MPAITVESKVVPDYIPPDAPATERDSRRLTIDHRRDVRGSLPVTPDFIPPEGYEGAVPSPTDEERLAVAFDAAIAAEQRYYHTVFEDARKALEGRNAPEVVQVLEHLSPNEQELYLIAEERGAGRKSVLEKFPKPRQEIRDKVDADGVYHPALVVDVPVAESALAADPAKADRRLSVGNLAERFAAVNDGEPAFGSAGEREGGDFDPDAPDYVPSTED